MVTRAMLLEAVSSAQSCSAHRDEREVAQTKSERLTLDCDMHTFNDPRVHLYPG